MGETRNQSWPPILTDEQVAEYLQIPFSAEHITSLRTKAHVRLPHIRFSVSGETLFRYPLDELREWVQARTTDGDGGMS